MKADPKQTHAVVVGIEKYASASWNLTDGSPSASAIGFCRYLHEHGVAGQKTHLLLSALEDRGPVPGSPQIRGATRADFTAVIKELRAETGDLLIVYWCGHGVIDLNRDRRLFFADAEKELPLNLELDPFLAVLASEWFPGFRQQLLMIDACATPMTWNFTFDTPGERFTPKEPVATSQAVLYSDLQLETAQSGLLWRTLEPSLGEQPPERWPPDVDELIDQLRGEFEQLDADQRPGLDLRDWHGQRIHRVSPAAPEAPARSGPPRIFYSYARKDKALRDELAKHLTILVRLNIINSLDRRAIEAGSERDKESERLLREADIILLLVSANFLESDYIWDYDLKIAVERHEKGEVKVIPIMLSPAIYKGAPFSNLLALPRDGPVTKRPDRDQAFADIAREIRDIALNMAKS